MHLTNEILSDARKLKPAALEALLAYGYVSARRIAHALSGDERVARAVADLLAQRSLRLLSRWRDVSTPENWFYHHTVLTTRSINLPPPDPHRDPLVTHGPANDPAYVAFIRALRKLPPQQREAFILHHGERLNPRMLAVAMDCSTQAAFTHLKAAGDALETIAGGRLESLTAALTRAYAGLNAAEPDSATVVRVHVRNVRRRIWLRRAIAFATVALILAAIGATVWLLRRP